MIRLHLLGAARLVDADGADVAAILKQPKRLALLAYVAAADPRRFHRRDSLLAVFWPEADEARARAALRRALHFLRRRLGDDVLVTRGDEVGLNTDRFWCDVTAVREHLATGRDATALEAWTGNLLEGFFVPTAPEFERWLDAERAQLQRTMAEAAGRLAATAADAGTGPEAIRWARRAIELAPDDEALLGRVLVLLDRAGDRTTALQLYDVFARRLADEFDVEPSPETRELVRAIRERRAAHPGRSPDTGSPTPPVSPNLIAVLPFAVRGDEALAYLREGLVDLLGTKLDGAGELRTVDAHAVLTRVDRARPDLDDPAIAAREAARFGAGAYLTGSVVADRDRLQLRVTLREIAGGKEIRADAEGDAEEGIFAMVDSVVRALLAGRSTSVGGHLGRLATVTTGSLPALKRYLAAEGRFRAGMYADALENLEAAVADDDEFALAWYRLSAARAARGLFESAREASERAWEGRRRLARHTAHLLEAQRAWLAGDIERAERSFTRVLDDRPEDVEAWYHLGYLRFSGNAFRGRSAREARQALERTVELDPKHVAALATLAHLASIERRTDDLARLVERYVALSPAGDLAIPLRALRAFATGALDEQRAISQLLGTTAPQTVAAAAAAIVSSGAPGAVEALDRLATAASTDAGRLIAHVVAAHAQFAEGAFGPALGNLDAAATFDPIEACVHRAWLLATGAPDGYMEEIQRARSMLASLIDDDGRDSGTRGRSAATHDGLHGHLRIYLDALLALRAGDLGSARSAATRCEDLPVHDVLAPMPANLASGIRACAALAAGEPADAVAVLDEVRLGSWVHFAARSPIFALAIERAARAEALAATGREAEAVGWRAGLGERSPFERVLADGRSARPWSDAKPGSVG